MNSKTVVTTKSYFRLLHILFFALVMGQVLFAAAAVLINLTQPPGPLFTGDTQGLIAWLVPAVALINIGASALIFRAQIKRIRERSNWEGRLRDYRSALLLRYALMEAPSLFAMVMFMLTGNYLFPCVALGVLFVFFIFRPTPSAMAAQLQLHDQERLLLQDPEAVLYEEEWAVS